MALLDELSRTLTDMGREAAQKTKDVVDVLQLKAQVGSERAKLRDLYATIGKAYFEQHRDKAKTKYGPVCAQIQSALDKIADMEAKISKMENTVTCSACGAVLGKDAVYCSKCGVPLKMSGQEPAKDTPVLYVQSGIKVGEDESVDDRMFVDEMEPENKD